ncbi:hypothetical protein HW537_13975 [Asaia siamensis]
MALDLNVAPHVGGWIIKASDDPKPRRINDNDISYLNELVRSQSGASREAALEALGEALAGWIVQRAKGEKPSMLSEPDFSVLLDFLPPADLSMTVPETVPEPVAVEMTVVGPENAKETMPPARVSAPEMSYPPQMDMALFHLRHGV